MSVLNKGALELGAHNECKKHQKAVRGNTSYTKVRGIFTTSESKSDDAVSSRRCVFISYHATS